MITPHGNAKTKSYANVHYHRHALVRFSENGYTVRVMFSLHKIATTPQITNKNKSNSTVDAIKVEANLQEQSIMIICILGLYSPSNDSIANVVHRDLDLYFQRHNFWKYIIYNIWKTASVRKKILKHVFYRLIFAIEWRHHNSIC